MDLNRSEINLIQKVGRVLERSTGLDKSRERYQIKVDILIYITCI